MPMEEAVEILDKHAGLLSVNTTVRFTWAPGRLRTVSANVLRMSPGAKVNAPDASV